MGLKRIFSKSSVVTDSKSVMSSDSEVIPKKDNTNSHKEPQTKKAPTKTYVSAASYLSLKG